MLAKQLVENLPKVERFPINMQKVASMMFIHIEESESTPRIILI
jgi:hypothetical protein